MALDNESFNKQLYDLLKTRGYKPVSKNARNQDVSASQQADVMEFVFSKDGESYGKAWATIDNASKVILYYDNDIEDSPEGRTPGVDYDDSWSGFKKHLSNWAQRKQLDFELANKDRLSDDMRQREYVKMKEKISEGYYPMGKQASYNDSVPTVKIILQHNRKIEEGEQRYRNIAKIFLENTEGERILAPTTRPGIAQVYARHLAEGGVPNDERWNHIKGLCEEYNKMAGFVRATRNNQFNESAQALVNEGINHYNKLRESLSKMRGHRGYNAYFESYTPTLMETDGDENLNELFVQETLDPRIESVMPILSRLRKNLGEMSEVTALESWANDIISEKMDSTTKSLAVPADEMLDEAPGAETLGHNQSTEKSNLAAFDLDEEASEGRPYICLHAKKGRFECHANSSYEAAKKAAQKWGMKNTAGIDAHLADIKHSTASLGESEQVAVIYVDGKPATKYTRKYEAEQDAEILRKKYPNKKIEIKQEIREAEQPTEEKLTAALKKVEAKIASEQNPQLKMKLTHKTEEIEAALKQLKDQPKPATKSSSNNPLSRLKGDVDDAGKSAGGNDENFWMALAKLGVGLSEELDEGFSTEGEATLAKIAAAGDAGYDMIEDGINGLLGTEAQTILQDMYDDISIDHRLHPDDDFEEIYDRMMDRIENDYGNSDADIIDEVDMGQADRTLRHTPRGDDGKMSHITSLNKAAKKMGHDSYVDVPDDAVEKLKALAKKIRSGEEVEEGLDANQKRVGQLGPTEKVGPKGAVGKLVGASESIKHDPLDDLKRLLGN